MMGHESTRPSFAFSQNRRKRFSVPVKKPNFECLEALVILCLEKQFMAKNDMAWVANNAIPDRYDRSSAVAV